MSLETAGIVGESLAKSGPTGKGKRTVQATEDSKTGDARSGRVLWRESLGLARQPSSGAWEETKVTASSPTEGLYKKNLNFFKLNF